ncbi:peptide-methionine (R)-S-oxide reductase [Candidatus Saccharibacteria bacterium]|nr:MAG: peptide-methionine (R)-S-oxide reductase [Candidatus Saccharibacteria bacterium]
MANKSLTEDEWKKKLTPQQFHVLREKGTEHPGSGVYLDHDEDGMYSCAGCGNKLFKSDSKYESTLPGLIGWPSFSELADDASVKLVDDNALGMQRTEVICAKCGGHLGHVFPDHTSDTGQHYCINSVALNFKADKETT